MNIFSITAREILDSRGNATLETEVTLENGTCGKASVPAGASVGVHEVVALPAADAIFNVQEVLAPLLKGRDVSDQKGIDALMCQVDGTVNKSKLGANAILSVSLACARAGALVQGVPLYQYISSTYHLITLSSSAPHLMLNILNGGVHGGFSLDVQEFMVVPQVARVADAIEMGMRIRGVLKTVLERQGITPRIGDEGGLTVGYPSPCPLPQGERERKKGKSSLRLSLDGRGPAAGGGEGVRISNEDGLKFLIQAIKDAGYVAGKDVMLALDVAASEFYDTSTGRYRMQCDGKELTSSELALVYQDWLQKYPLISFEDPFAQDDWEAWRMANSKWHVLLVGDDLFTTNITRLEQGIAQHAATAILIKPNQIGALTETIDCVKRAQAAHMQVIVSHRSGETMDHFIADLAMAVGANYLKSGSPSQPVRMAKYLRLQEMQTQL